MNQHAVGRSPLPESTYRVLVLVLILFTALGFRAWAAATAPAEPIADAADYHRLAVGLVEGRGYVNESGQETAWRPPGYPLFLAAIYRLAGARVSAAAFIQIIIGALTVLALILLAILIVGWRDAVISGFVAAVYPGFIWLPRLLLSENVSLFLLVLTLLATALFLKTNRLWWMVVAGGVGGINALVRGGNIMVLFGLCAALIVVAIRNRSPQPRQAILGSLLALAVLAIVLTPWTIRNYRVFHSFVPQATQEGLTLYASYWPPQKNGRLIWGTLPGVEDPYVAKSAQLGDEVSTSRYLQSVTRQRLLAQPGYFFRLIPSKMASLLVPFDWEIFPHGAGQTRSLNLGYLIALPFSLLGCVTVWRRPRPMQWLLWLLPIIVLIQAVMFYGSPRFRLPAELVMIILAAIGLSQTWSFFKSRFSLLR